MFCHKCGNQIEEGAGFCQKCGTKLANVNSTSQMSGENSFMGSNPSNANALHNGELFRTYKVFFPSKTSTGSVGIRNGELRLTGEKREQKADGSFAITTGEQVVALSDIKGITLKQSNSAPLMGFSLAILILYALLYIVAIAGDFLYKVFDYSYATDTFLYIAGLIMYIGGPILGIFFMVANIRYRKGRRIHISHNNGTTDVYVHESEIDAAEASIAKFNTHHK